MSPENEPFAEGFTLTVASDEHITELFKNYHVLVYDGQDKAKVDHAAVPLPPLVLRQYSLYEMIGTVGSIRETEPFKNGRLTLFDASNSCLTHNMDVPLSARVGPELLELCLVQINDVALRQSEVCLNLKLILVGLGTFDVF